MGFPLEEQSMRLTTFNTLIEPPLPVCTCGVRAQTFFLSDKGEGQSQGFLRRLGLSSFMVSPGAHCGNFPRPLAFNEAASRPPAVVDSSTALAFHEAGLRGWINLLFVRPKECERDRTNSPGLFLHGRPGGRSMWLVRRLRRVHPLGLGGDCPSA